MILLITAAFARPLAVNAWLVGTVEVPVSERVAVSVAPEARWDVTDGITDRLLTTVAASFRAHDHLSLGVHYRADLREWGEGVPELAHRLALDVSGHVQTGVARWSLRQRLQPEWRPAQDAVFTQVLRTRLHLRVATGGVEPYAAVEPYVVAGPREAFLQRMRFDLGAAIEPGPVRWDLSYRIDHPTREPGAAQEHIVTLAARWSLPDRWVQGADEDVASEVAPPTP